MRGYEVAAESLLAAGVKTVFGLLGNTNLATIGLLSQRGVRFVSSRHESGAVGMAAGAAWATGQTSTCTVTHGPGLSNALTALTSAARDRVPMVMFVGDIRNAAPWMSQHADHVAMLGWTGAGFIDCCEASAIAASIARGYAQAERERRPVIVNVLGSLLAGEAGMHRPAAAQPSAARAMPVAANVASLREAAELLAGARRPVIVGGRGAVAAKAGAVLTALADRCGALVATTLPARGVFAGNDFDLGVCGGYATATARALLAQADCVAAFGTGLNGFTTIGGKAFPQASLIQCDDDADARGRFVVPRLFLHGDAAATAEALTLELDRLLPSPVPGFRSDDVRRRILAARSGADYPDLTSPEGVDPRAALFRLDGVFPQDRQIVIDVGHFATFPSQVLCVPAAGRFFSALGFGSVGQGLGVAIGAAEAMRRPTILVVGDGGLLMSLTELETLSRLGAPLTVVVLNDDAYGAEIRHLRGYGLPELLAHFPSCDFAAIGTALGIQSFTVRALADIDRLAGRPWGKGPTILDVRITRATLADYFAAG